MDKLNKTLPATALFGLCALILCLRLHTYNEPLERDVTTYAVIAHEMLGGRALYSDLWDHKPPAIHVTYAAAEVIAGYGRNSIFLMNVASAIATLLACYFAGSAAGGGRTGGLVAASLWALISGDLAIEGNQPNTEVFLNACLTTAFAVFVRAEKRNLGPCGALLVGLLFAVASLYKQVVVAQAALLAFAYLAWPPDGLRKRAVADVAIIAGVGAAAWAMVLGYFYALGRGAAFTEAVFTYNRDYSGGILKNLSHTLSSQPVSPDVIAVILPLAIVSVIGLVLGLIFGPGRQWILLLGFAIGTHIAVLLPGWFFAHYYQLWLPPLAIGTGWAVALLKRILPSGMSWPSYATAGIACAGVVTLEVPYYQASAEIWSMRKYGYIFLETERVARKIDGLLSPSGTFYEWGRESGFYFTSGRRPPSGIVFADPLLRGPAIGELSRRLINDLERAKPDLIIVEDEIRTQTRGHPVMNWIEENYRPFARTKMFLLLARKGSQLDRQQQQPSNKKGTSI
jgi:4-amino-4-deoxy-L-arabinose transferase-like glycosyltransferase